MEQPPPQQPPPRQPWGQPPPRQQPWGYRPPEPPKGQRPPGTPPPWYRHPVGLLLIAAVVVIVLALVAPFFTGGGADPVPTVTSGAFIPPSTAAPATTTSAGQPATAADRLRQAAQAELREAGEVTSVTAPPGGQITVTWEIRQAATQGLTENNARFGVMRIMRAVQQSDAAADYQGVRLLGRSQLPGQAAPATVVRLRFDPETVESARFDDRRYTEAFELADSAAIHPAFRG